MSVSLSTAEKQGIKLLAQCLVQSRCSSISVELIKQWMKVEWLYVTRPGMQKDCTFFQTIVRNMQFITWWLRDVLCIWKLAFRYKWQSREGTTSWGARLPPHSHPRCEALRLHGFRIWLHSTIQVFTVQWWGNGAQCWEGCAVGGVGAPVCCLRHDILYPCAEGLRELAMELHQMWAISPPSSQNKRHLHLDRHSTRIHPMTDMAPLAPPPTTKPSEPPPADLLRALTVY